MPRQFYSPNGFLVLVGKNASDNDRISFHLARPHDYWFHVKDVPGAHVLLQWETSCPSQPNQDDIQFAAHAAAFYSKAKQLSEVPVVVACGSDLTPIPNTKKGTVHCNSIHTMNVNPYIFYQYQQQLELQKLQQMYNMQSICAATPCTPIKNTLVKTTFLHETLGIP